MFGINGVNVFMFLCFYLVLPIVYVTSRNEWKPKKNIMLGVTLPQALRGSEAVERIGALYKKELNRCCLILALANLPALFINSVSVSMTWNLIWMVAVIIAPNVVFVRGWKRLRELKQESGYEAETAEKKELQVDMSALTEGRTQPSVWWYVLPMAISLIPCVLTLDLWGTSSFWPMETVYLSMFGCILLMVVMTYRGLHRQRAEMVDERTELTLALTRVRRYNWHKMMLLTAWLTGGLSFLMYAAADHMVWILIGTAVYTVVMLALAMHTEFTVRRVQEKLTKDCGESLYVDEDEHWLWGLIYYNPHDKHVLKNNRTGMNMTVNLATTGGKIAALLTAVMILLLPFAGFWMIAEEFTPIKVYIEDDTLVADHLKEEYVIELEDICSVSVVNELRNVRKDIGTNMDHLLKGQFRVEEYGVCQLLLDPQTEAFMVVETEEDTYIFSMDEDVYEELLQSVK